MTEINEPFNVDRRRFVGTAAMAIAGAQLGMFAQAGQGRSPERRLCGGRPGDGEPVILLHGWPYDIHSDVDGAQWRTSGGCVGYHRADGRAQDREGRSGRL
jgi:hypothetical protein